jgi:hypothetical protein
MKCRERRTEMNSSSKRMLVPVTGDGTASHPKIFRERAGKKGKRKEEPCDL